jgi:hypothetical protein
MVVYALALVGMLIGWIRGFPLWSCSYLGWSLVFTWWWTNMRTYGFDWGYLSWIPLGITVLIAFLWTRSLSPVKKLFRDIWNDWTRLTFAMYTFMAFGAMIYDENHHPYLLLLMTVTIVIIISGVWFFLRSSTLKGRISSIVISFIASVVPGGISYLTWDWRAFHGLPPSDYWYDNLGWTPIGYCSGC